MRMLVNLLACLGIAITVLMVGMYYAVLIGDAADGAAGMGLLFLQLWGAIGAAAALLFGFIGRLMDRRVPLPAGRIANTAVAIGLLGGLLLFAAPFVFG